MAVIAGGSISASGVSETEDQPVRIGISQFVSHPALDAVREGIVDELTDRGWDDVEYDVQNANADVSTARQIATKFKSDRVDVAIGIATPVAQALRATMDSIPVVYTAITDPVSAGLVESLTEGEPGTAGVSHRTPVQQQIAFMMGLQDITSLGHVYSSGETNAVFLANQTEDAADALGIDFVSQTITNPSEVRTATQSIIDRVDALYVSTDNQVVSALSALSEVASSAGVPVLSADPDSAMENDVFIAWGFDWYAIGRTTGELVDRILRGTDPGSIPTVLVEDTEQMSMVINTTVAERLQITLPQEVLDQADTIISE
ncbi:MAG TPA: ABC transporter substrate-binding protein [Alkalispirochaeta sp.]|nr:ABC transporter substrate-binding protein [Alkalispirochaeta sp.]